MTNLAERFQNSTRLPKGPPCSVETLLSSLDDADRDALTEALNDRAVTAPQIIDVLLEHGIAAVPGQPQISKHRRGQCKCGRPA